MDKLHAAKYTIMNIHRTMHAFCDEPIQIGKVQRNQARSIKRFLHPYEFNSKLKIFYDKDFDPKRLKISFCIYMYLYLFICHTITITKRCQKNVGRNGEEA